MCHGRLPLIAGLDAARPVVHVWKFGPGGFRERGIVDAGAGAYPAEAWNRYRLVPSLAWHPHKPSLVVTGPAGLQWWTPDGASIVAGEPPHARYRAVAFSPDGRTLWASPASSLGKDEAWRHRPPAGEAGR